MISSTARVLFQSRPATVDEVMPTPRKGRKAAIDVYTDSNARVPTASDEDNPFLTKKGKGKAKAKTKSAAASRKADPKMEKMQEAVDRGEGMIYLL